MHDKEHEKRPDPAKPLPPRKKVPPTEPQTEDDPPNSPPTGGHQDGN